MVFLCFIHVATYAQISWSNAFTESKTIVANQGQFDNHCPNEAVYYAYTGTHERIYFCHNKVIIHLMKFDHHMKTDEEIRNRAERKKQDFNTMDEWVKFQKEGHKMDLTSAILETTWMNAQSSVEIETTNESSFTHGYLIDQYNGVSIDNVKSFEKITYKNIYPNIDIEYVLHPVTGLKYSIIVHPGGDPSQVKLHYSGNPVLLTDGTIETPTVFGNIMDHRPLTFYQDGASRISSSYKLVGNEISFQLSSYDASKTIVIDPWTQTPAYASNWDCVWECETDAAGNVYIIGGVTPLQLKKFNSAGTLQWTYNTPYDTSSWLGTMVTDNAGNTFVTQGSVAAMIRVSTAGALVWTVGNGTGMLSAEYWNIALNCDQTKLVTAGTGSGIPPQAYIYNINPANGAVLANDQVSTSASLFSIEEVRSITATQNEKYYWMSHDSIGYVSEIFGVCPGSVAPFHINSTYNLSYKCEDWRYNNSGIEALAYYNGYTFVNRGNRIDKRDFNTAAIVANAVIPGGTFAGGFGGSVVGNSGIAIDNCGNIYVGSKSQVVKYNQSLVQLATYAVPFNVYDIAIGTGGEIIAAGSTGTSSTASRTGYVTSINAGACAPYAMTCCNANICQPPVLCVTDAPITLGVEETGGTWSSTAPGFNTSTGVFNPATAGVGTYTVTYTQPCGSTSATIQVVGCVAMTLCVGPGGVLTVNGGAAPYTWTQPVHTVGCVAVIGPGCGLFDRTGTTHSWGSMGTGATLTPPVGADTVTVTDGLGATVTSFNISTLPACSSPLPVQLVAFNGTRASNGDVNLWWGTNAEINNDYFTVYRSSNGSAWEFVTNVKGKGTTQQPQDYSYTDKTTTSALVYYKLIQTDFNGQRKEISVIVLNEEGQTEMISSLFPNPATDQINFDVHSLVEDEPITIVLINALGQEIKRQVVNPESDITTLTLSLEEVPNGIYQLVAIQKDYTSNQKLAIKKSR